MIELSSSKAKSGFMKHVGIASWFRQLRNAQADFVSRERIVWVDIEGVPLHVWSRATFSKIGSRWGEVIDLEESSDDSFARKRICIKTSQEDNILERFKIIARGKVFILRAKELFVWSPSFKAAKEADYCSDEDVNKDATNNIEDDGLIHWVIVSPRKCSPAERRALRYLYEDAQLINAHDSPRVEHNIKTGGSILDVLENMIKETKLDVLSDMAVKTLWGNHSLSRVNVCYGIIFRLSLIVGMVIAWLWETLTKSGFPGDPNLGRCLNVQVANEVHLLHFLILGLKLEFNWKTLICGYIIKQQAMVFKVDFAKAYDSVRWDFLDDVLAAFGFGSKWRLWIRGSLYSGMASVLLNGSPSLEFEFHRGLKQGDPLAPYLFILIMESFHLSISRAVDAGIFRGINISDDLNISHLFYADDAVFIGKWNELNLSGIIQILRCFSLLSGLNINLSKSHLLGVGVPFESVNNAAAIIGCSTMRTPFKYLGVMVGDNTSKVHAWDDTISKVKSRLSNWKSKTLSVGGRLTLIKSVLGSTPIYAMSIYKVPKAVLKILESIRRNFFNGVNSGERKITWVAWSKILASKKHGGLGVSSFYALNRALLFKWVWRFISGDNSLWYRFIKSMYGTSLSIVSMYRSSIWNSILKEVSLLKDHGIDLLSHCQIRVGNGLRTQFWNEIWIAGTPLRDLFPRIYALETLKGCSVASKLLNPINLSLRRDVRDGVESYQLALLEETIGSTILSNMEDMTWRT
ncbi:RNA-directed DNA polymerase, eukaryota [Tanacetum coccineum]